MKVFLRRETSRNRRAGSRRKNLAERFRPPPGARTVPRSQRFAKHRRACKIGALVNMPPQPCSVAAAGDRSRAVRKAARRPSPSAVRLAGPSDCPPKNPRCTESVCGYVPPVDWQQVISLMIVGSAAVALLWGRFRRRKSRFGLETHCGCAGSPATNPQSSIIFHARKGHRPRVLVKLK